MLLLDVDGVLTGGEIIYTDSGEQVKLFDVKDGIGIRMLKAAGLEVGIITGRTGSALRHRCKNLGIDLIYDGIRDKAQVMEQISSQTGLAVESMAFVGDDLPDLAVLKKAGLAVAVGDAHEMIKAQAHITTQALGGHGAVREVCEAILKAQGKWDDLVKQLFS
ncbi:MAG: HAD hydrolase family protein [Desulfobacteraceae bacterium]|nr:HAD hydrolase family protein [Desulfobacteraceae bacterium]